MSLSICQSEGWLVAAVGIAANPAILASVGLGRCQSVRHGSSEFRRSKEHYGTIKIPVCASHGSPFLCAPRKCLNSRVKVLCHSRVRHCNNKERKITPKKLWA